MLPGMDSRPGTSTSGAWPLRTDLGEGAWPGAWIDLWPELVPDPDGVWMAGLVDELPLHVEVYRMGGREVRSPRLVSWHGDPGTGYAYSGVPHEPAPWTPRVSELRARVEAATGLRFNSVLANLYRDGQDSVGWHADAEPEIGPSVEDRWVASLSFGHPRRFVLCHKKTGARHELALGNGALLVMRGATQSHWRHSVPKTTRPVGPRLNLTFRHIVCRPVAER
jgi:alkylated DNA repair dioxygenase AlkB